MSKKKRSKKRERIPVIDTLIDLAGAMTLDYLAAIGRQKNGTKRSKKTDPYAATGAAMGMGLIKDTDDLIKFGGVLGTMGAFDPDDDLPISTAAYMAPRDNRYAWRLNCEDGSAYGIDPNDYETRDEYNEALNKERHGWRDYCEDGSDYGISPEDYETEEEYNAAIEKAESNSFDEDEGDELIITDGSSENATDGAFPECSSKRDNNPIGKHDPFAADDFHVYARIADALNLSVNSVKSFCRRNALNGAAVNPVGQITGETTQNAAFCEQCGQLTVQTPGRKHKRFCSDVCRTAWWNAHRTQVRRKTMRTFCCARCGM